MCAFTFDLTIEEKNCLVDLKRLIEECEDELLMIRKGHLDDNKLLIFIRGCNFDISKCIKRITKLFNTMDRYQFEYFQGIFSSAIRSAISSGFVVPLKQNDDYDRTVVIIRLSKWDMEKISVDDMIEAMTAVGWELLRKKSTQVHGIVSICDVSEFEMKHMKMCSPRVLWKYVDGMMNASPMKLKAIHYLRGHAVARAGFSAVKMLLPNKLRNRIHFHGYCLDHFYNSVSPNILPLWLGGSVSDEDCLDYQFLQYLANE